MSPPQAVTEYMRQLAKVKLKKKYIHRLKEASKNSLFLNHLLKTYKFQLFRKAASSPLTFSSTSWSTHIHTHKRKWSLVLSIWDLSPFKFHQYFLSFYYERHKTQQHDLSLSCNHCSSPLLQIFQAMKGFSQTAHGFIVYLWSFFYFTYSPSC